ncbi:zf-HC2 domain-containing protein [Paenibacillus sp. FJAT-26967]|uniref:zf-HC2 domain-containing protein n=1 Tax=Paenibacillus sp. FJAT-26967 TaxID=1729690 RepID=UPI000839426B|nr:zf-HC2 domain-containing protein [Paenibacillus sp. FJAT-26967]
MNCKQALPLMHEYLDGDLQGSEALDLKQHLLTCPECHAIFRQMETTDALVRSIPAPVASNDLTDRIMGSLPPVKKRSPWIQWVRKHPAVSVAAVFLLTMAGSFGSMWNNNTELMVRGTDLDRVIIQGDKVIVPKGETVKGNLVVENGELVVEDNANVEGNLVVIDGNMYLASTAHITGDKIRIDQALSWLWFKINEIVH